MDELLSDLRAAVDALRAATARLDVALVKTDVRPFMRARVLITDLRIGPGSKLYQLGSSPATGVTINQFSLRRTRQRPAVANCGAALALARRREDL